MADATTATTPKIEELRARLRADPKSRHFYPLAEELRKIQQLEEAEQILRDGIQTHSTYLSAWISLGRVLRERGREHEAVEVLKRALALDAGNVVAAKLLAQAYLGTGDKVEAIKKFKLVYALMPADEEVEREIERIDRELNPDKYPAPALPAVSATPEISTSVDAPPFGLSSDEGSQAGSNPFGVAQEPSRFDSTDTSPFKVEDEPFGSTADAALSSLLEPSRAEESLFPASDDAGEVRAPILSESSLPIADATGDLEAEPFGEVPAEVAPSAPAAGLPESELEAGEILDAGAPPAPIPATMTMAKLYERQGHDEQAAQLYRQILEQQPNNADARDALSRAEGGAEGSRTNEPRQEQKIRRLEQWRARVAKT